MSDNMKTLLTVWFHGEQVESREVVLRSRKPDTLIEKVVYEIAKRRGLHKFYIWPNPGTGWTAWTEVAHPTEAKCYYTSIIGWGSTRMGAALRAIPKIIWGGIYGRAS